MVEERDWLTEELRRLALINLELADVEERVLKDQDLRRRLQVTSCIRDHRRHARELLELIRRHGRGGAIRPLDEGGMRRRLTEGAIALEDRAGLGMRSLRNLELIANQAYCETIEERLPSPHLPESRAINEALGVHEDEPGVHVPNAVWAALRRQRLDEERHLQTVTEAMVAR